jgi:hypothetical protein
VIYITDLGAIGGDKDRCCASSYNHRSPPYDSMSFESLVVHRCSAIGFAAFARMSFRYTLSYKAWKVGQFLCFCVQRRRSRLSMVCGLPCVTVRSLLQLFFRGLVSVQSGYGLHARRVRQATIYTESSDSFVASAAASVATGWSEPVSGRELHPLKSSAFHGALLRQLSDRAVGNLYLTPFSEFHEPCSFRTRIICPT